MGTCNKKIEVARGGEGSRDLVQKGQAGCWKIIGDRLHMPGGLELVSKLLLSQTLNSNKQEGDFWRPCRLLLGGPETDREILSDL